MKLFLFSPLFCLCGMVLAEPETPLAWEAGEPFLDAARFGDNEWIAIKDPTIIRYKDRWHLFCTLRGNERSHAIVYSSFDEFENADLEKPIVLPNHDGYFCAPQVFYFTPQKKWYLICQAKDSLWDPVYQAAYATSDNIGDPNSWSPLQPMEAIKPEGHGWLDFWVICDEEKAHLFYTSDDGTMWRADTPLADFPLGWSEPDLALETDIFEANHVYRLTDGSGYLNVIEAQARADRRYYKAYLSDRLDGEWRPVADTIQNPYAAAWGPGQNVQRLGGQWTHSISHGEMIRTGYDEAMEADPNADFLFQGVLHEDRQGKPYGEIPWRLAILKPQAE